MEFAKRPGNIAIPLERCRELVHFRENLCIVRHQMRRFLRRHRYSRRVGGPARLTILTALTALSLGLGLPTAAQAAPGADEMDASKKLNQLLDAAEAAERTGHLIYPAQGSAMSIYYDVLFMDPSNGHALEGLTRLAEHHLEAAQIALDQGQLIKADSLVSKARMIYPEYPAVAILQHKLTLLEHAERTRETLDWRLVAERSQSLSNQLLRLGRVAKKGDCRATINVSNDSEGRWVYQIMNRAEGEHRLRANVKIASPAAVEILCFSSPDDSAHLRAPDSAPDSAG